MHYRTDHAEDQLRNRHAISASYDDWRDAFLDIVDGRSLLMARVSCGRERHAVRIRGTAVQVIYEPRTALIITTLPQGFRLRCAMPRPKRYRYHYVSDDERGG